MLVRWVPVAILGCAGVGGAVGLIADLRVLLDVCQWIAAAAVPLVALVMWPEYGRFAETSVTSSRANEQAPLPAALDR